MTLLEFTIRDEDTYKIVAEIKLNYPLVCGDEVLLAGGDVYKITKRKIVAEPSLPHYCLLWAKKL